VVQRDHGAAAEVRPPYERQSEWALLHLLAALADIAADVETKREREGRATDVPRVERGRDDAGK
jgi:hypothetical protein